mmetsp:Transcript_4/g.10  ORF Transcript_4/g.10 Transcript_4/m.10 type:complete len:131 (-) Transcript_4:363-755(-)|eukprot:CAMPEP_0194303876 /NCGR_PEP_ID=MMETSP0171-20130528/1688_1 /TAXON_ID=218684 /ORGANISM="Corethron pennatum, Strain L29A3" /LENGTH=130 /DNA_ID=CAMNT_0039054935 /DNA_START=84 /DNA_END=476 /DNA_ORIENTATION=-
MASKAFAALDPTRRFEVAVEFIRTGGSDGKGTGVPSALGFGQKDRLEYYKHYKQYTAGDIMGEKPSLWAATVKAGGPIAGAEALMKFDAWTGVKGMGKEAALDGYIEAIVRHTLTNGREKVLLEFIEATK